jgi:4,5-dihydroxyphthalate decarboxylase
MSLTLPAFFATSPWTSALKTGALKPRLFSFDFTEIEPVYDGFPRVVRGDFAVAELSLATFTQAVTVGMPRKLLPVALAQRVQHPSLMCHAERPLTPAQLSGKKIAVRSYAQTTGVWIRGLLLDRYGVDPKSITWVTIDDGHVTAIRDPDNCVRAPSGSSMLKMLERGEVDAAIFGSGGAPGDFLRPVITDLPSDDDQWRALMGYVPINHALTVSTELAESRPDILTELIALFTASQTFAKTDKTRPVLGADAFMQPLRDCSRYLLSQGLIARIPEPASLFAMHE